MKLRAPAVPLVTYDPYFSIWSMADKLPGEDTRHWTGKPHRLTGTLTTGGKSYCFMGRSELPCMEQAGLEVDALSSSYRFTCPEGALEVTFTTPLLLDDLMLLSRLPAGDGVGAEAARYTRSRNRYVRFYALMTQLAAEPATSLRRMAEYDYPFSACEVSEIMAMLRRGLLPIAYEPLVGSPNRNLRMVGLGIVRQFGIEEAERLLLAMVARERVPELGREALYTLCSMRCSLRRREVAGRIASMSRAERKALMRYMAREGYAPAVLRRLFGDRERPYYESLIHSYKRSLVC